jgi:hypothetical protein
MNEDPTMVSMELVFQVPSTASCYAQLLPGEEDDTYASSGGKCGSCSLEQLKLEIANVDRNKGNDKKDSGMLHVS